MTRPRDIAIIGCGPAGMATALLLRRAGFNVRIFERFDQPKPVGAGLLLQPTGLAVLGRLGLRARWTTLGLTGHGFEAAVLAQRYVAARRMVGVLPVGSAPGNDGAQAAFFWSRRMDGVEAWKNGGLARWKDEVTEIWPDAGGLIAGIDQAEALQPAFYVHYTARRPAGLRLAVIGDAALRPARNSARAPIWA